MGLCLLLFSGRLWPTFKLQISVVGRETLPWRSSGEAHVGSDDSKADCV